MSIDDTEENTIRMIMARYQWDNLFGIHPGVRLLKELSIGKTSQQILGELDSPKINKTRGRKMEERIADSIRFVLTGNPLGFCRRLIEWPKRVKERWKVLYNKTAKAEETAKFYENINA